MIAIPVKTNKENTAVSTLFGKAKYFALINNNHIEIIKNEQLGGKAVANWLKSKNVNILITSHMGERPLSTLLNNKIEVYFAGNERIEISDVLLKYADGELPILNDKNFRTLIKEDSHNHGNSCSRENRKIEKIENKLQKPKSKNTIKNIHV